MSRLRTTRRNNLGEVLGPPTVWQAAVALLLASVISLLVPLLTPQARHSASAAHTTGLSAARVVPQSLIIEERCTSGTSSSARARAAMAAAAGRTGRLTASSPLRFAGPIGSGQGAYLSLDQSALASLSRRASILLQDFVLEQNRTVDLELREFHVFDERTEFVAGTESGDVPLAPPDVLLLRGSVRGVPGSRVFLGLSSHTINGFVSMAGETYSLSTGPRTSLAASGPSCAISKLPTEPGESSEVWECGAALEDIEPLPPRGLRAGETVDITPGLWICLLAVECDYAYFQEMGSDEAAAAMYVAQLIGAINEIYERDFSTALWLSYVRIWTTSKQPYTDEECGIKGLAHFRNYANVELADKKWTLAYKFSGCGSQGVAYIGSLCPADRPRGRDPYATSRVQGFFPYPLTPRPDNWDVVSVAHEIGHNFGSVHTHCYDPPIDSCVSDKGCYEGEPVCRRGTIMSYCNRCGGLGNIDLRFHPRVIEYVMQFVRASCMEVAWDGFYVINDGTETLIVDSILSTRPWLSVSRGSFRIAPEDSLIVAVHVDWTQLPEAGAHGQLFIHSLAGFGEEPVTLHVTANRQRPFTDFTMSTESGCWPLVVEFTDMSVNNPAEWIWDFGDGNQSTEPQPTYTYERVGEYTVTLTTANACGAHTVSAPTPIVVTEPQMCCSEQIFVVTRNESRINVHDLWSCAREDSADPALYRYDIVANSEPDCGVRIDANRHLSIDPAPGWFGRSNIIVQATSLDGCRCQSAIQVIVNDPPKVEILNPGPGTHLASGSFLFSWTDSDHDNNASIYFFSTPVDDCSGGDAINVSAVFEDLEDEGDFLEWNLGGVMDGYYRIKAMIYDLFASSYDCSEGIVLVDQTPPVTTSSYECTSEEEDGWCNGPISVQLQAADSLVAVEATYYRVNGASWRLYTGPVEVSVGGQSDFEYYSVDIAGNEESIKSTSERLKVDRSPPNVSGISSDNVEFRRGDYNSSTPTFAIQLTDDGIGIEPRSLSVSIAPGTAQGPLFYAVDTAGFQYNESTHRVKVSVTTPLLPGVQTLSVDLADALGNTASGSMEFVVGSNLAIERVVNHPNPFPQRTKVGTDFTFVITQDATVSVRIFDLSGDIMKVLKGRELTVGYNMIEWDGRDANGNSLANGTYIYEIVASNTSGTVRHLDMLAVLR